MSTKCLDVTGKFHAEVECPLSGANVVAEFIVIKGHDKTLLGLKTCIDLNVPRVGPPKKGDDVYQVDGKEIEAQFPDIMLGIGKLKDVR